MAALQEHHGRKGIMAALQGRPRLCMSTGPHHMTHLARRVAARRALPLGASATRCSSLQVCKQQARRRFWCGAVTRVGTSKPVDRPVLARARCWCQSAPPHTHLDPHSPAWQEQLLLVRAVVLALRLGRLEVVQQELRGRACNNGPEPGVWQARSRASVSMKTRLLALLAPPVEARPA